MIAFVCETCGAAVCPDRALCSRCGAGSWREVPAGSGLVEEMTRVDGAAIASVRLDCGPVVVARVSGDAAPGDRVDLTSA